MNKSLFCYALAAGLFLHTAVQAHGGDKEPAPVFGNTSLQLIANRGQVTDQHGQLRPDIDAKAEHNGVTMFVGDGQLHYQWVRSESQKSKVKTGKSDSKDIFSISPEEGRKEAVSIYRMDVTLVGADRTVQPLFEEPTGYFENYYLAHTGESGVQAKGYNRVVYKNVYPNIDWVVYISPLPASPQRGGEANPDDEISAKASKTGNTVTSPRERPGEAVLKYDFIVHPGGNVADIRMRYEGATELKIEDGALLAVTPFGSITEDAPYSYELDGGQVVASKYILEGNELRFDVGSYNATLVIDPELKWGTYYSDAHGGGASGVAADTAGYGYLSGQTNAANIATTGAYQVTLTGTYDIYIVKFNHDGKTRKWCTYFGGSGYEYSAGITADKTNGIYIAGRTNSTDSIVGSSGVYQSQYPGAKIVGSGSQETKAFVARFDTDGKKVWSSYYSDSMLSYFTFISADSAGNVYGIGRTETDNLHLHTHKYGTTGAFITTPPSTSGFLTFMVKFNKNGQRVWGSYLKEYWQNITGDDVGNAYVTGSTADNNLGTAGTHQQVYAGGGDALLLKLGTSGQKLWFTYFGGAASDAGAGIAVYKNSVFLLGGTYSTSGIAFNGPHQSSLVGAVDGFLAKFNVANGKLDWGTYYGGNETFQTLEDVRDIIISKGGDVFIYGMTSTSGMATTPTHQSSFGGGTTDMLLARFSNGGKLKWASYYGGTGFEQYTNSEYSMWLAYSNDHVFISGMSYSGTNIATANTYQSTYNSTKANSFLAKFFIPDTLVYIHESFNDTFACTGDTLHVPYKVTRNFNSNNTFKVLLSNSSGGFANPVTLATVTRNSDGVIACYLPTTIAAGAGYRIKIAASNPIDTSADNDFNIKIGNYPAAFSASVNKTALCTADTLKLNSSTTTTGVTYAWSGPNSFTAGTANATIPNPSLAATGNYYIAIDNKGCVARDTFAVIVAQSPENVTASNNGPVCTGDTLRLTSSSSTGGVTYKWSPGNYSTQNVNIPNVAKTQGGAYTVTATLGSCTTTATTTVQVEQAPVINIVPTAGVALCIGELAQFAAFLNDAGANPQLQWQVNGVDKAGETTSTFKTATLNHGDKVRLKVIPNTSCPGTRYSNEITMGIYAPKAPTVSIVADINPPWDDNTIVTFTATAANATSVNGVPPTYQWKKNGQDIGGAVSNYWAVNTNALNDNDKICVLVTSAYECPVPDTVLSNCINSEFTGVNDVPMSGVKVYPNPVTNALHIDGVPTGYSVALYDVVGRKCNIVYQDGSMDMSALPAGNYVLQVTDSNGERAYFKVTKE